MKKFITYVTAAIASFAVFSLYSIIDGILVARGVNEIAMSAINLASPYISFLFSISVLFAVGTSTIISIMMGEDRRDSANALFSQNTALLFILGFTISLCAYIFAEPLAKVLGAEGETLPYVIDYIRGISPFSFCFIVSYNMEILVKADGYPQYALFTVSFGCIMNFILAVLAIFVFKTGIYGTGLATGFSQFLTVVLYLAHFFGKKATFRFRRFVPDLRIYGKLLRLGLPDASVELCNGIMIFLFNHMVLRYLGEQGLIAYTIIAYLNTLLLNVAMGVSQGTQPLISYQFGARRPDRIRQLLRYEFIAAGILSALALLVFECFAPGIAAMFLKTGGTADVSFAARAIRLYSLSFAPVVFNIVIGGFFAAIEKPGKAFVISYGRGIIVQAAVLLLLCAATAGHGIWFTPLISEVICLTVALIFLRSILGRKDGLLHQTSSASEDR